MTARNIFSLVWRTALVWAVSLFVVPLAAHALVAWIKLDPFFGGFFHALAFGLPAGGLLAGFFTVQFIRKYGGLPAARVIVPTAAWGVAMFLAAILPLQIGTFFLENSVPVLEGVETEPYSPPYLRIFATSVISWLAAGLVGGWGTAIGLWAGGLPAGWRKMSLIALSWGVALALSAGIVETRTDLLYWLYLLVKDLEQVDMIMHWSIKGAIGLFGGPAGMLLTLAVIRKAMQAHAVPPGDQLDLGSLGPVKL